MSRREPTFAVVMTIALCGVALATVTATARQAAAQSGQAYAGPRKPSRFSWLLQVSRSPNSPVR